MNKKKIDWHFAAGISVRLTALDVMTNQPISPAPSIYVQLNSISQAPITSPGVIPNVTLGTQVFALSFDNTRVIGHIVAYAKDISNDGIMDVTLMLSPQMVQRFPLLQTFPFHTNVWSNLELGMHRVVTTWAIKNLFAGSQPNADGFDVGRGWHKLRPSWRAVQLHR
jgi:hypothetical protein